MSDDPERDRDDERAQRGGGEAEVDDQPLGVPEELDPEDAPLPGMPDKEPPSSG